jgi:hypothetical protein
MVNISYIIDFIEINYVCVLTLFYRVFGIMGLVFS